MLALTGLALAGCATFGNNEPPAPTPAPVVIPTVPADVLSCARAPVDYDDSKGLSAGEVERMWKTDRSSLAKVNACLHRVVCQYQEVRAEIGQTESVSCDKSKPKKSKRRPGWLSLLRKGKS